MPTAAFNPIRSVEAFGYALGHYMACIAQGETWVYTSRYGFQYAIRCMPQTGDAKMRLTLNTRTQETKTRIEAAIQNSNPGAYVDTAGSWTNGVATLTVGAHSIVAGDTIVVSGVNPSGFNGTFLVSAITGTTFSYALQSNPGSWISGGSELSATTWPPLCSPGTANLSNICVDETLTDPNNNIFAIREWELDDLRGIFAFTQYNSIPRQTGVVGQ